MASVIPRLIDRGGLLAALDRAAAGRVTVISAPAGSGKTCLLRAWADRPGQPYRLAVLQVQRDQHDAQQFWLALLNAVRQASGTASRAEASAATPGFNAPAMVDRVLAELADARDGITLVIDDLHELHSPEAIGLLTRLLTSLPPHVHAVLATRRDLRLRLQRLRLAGELAEVLNGTAPVIGPVTVVETHLLAGLAHRALGDQRAANQATERALALAEPDRLVLPFAMTGAAGLLEALPRHQTAHAALLADILDVVHGASPPANDPSPSPQTEELSPGELRVLRYLPTNLSRPEIASELSVSVNTVNTHVRNIYAKLQARDRSAAVRRARQLRLLSAGRTR